MDQDMLMKIGSAARSELLARYKSRLQSGQSAIRERYLAETDAPRLLHGRSQLIDELLRELWKELHFPDSLALVAVGGYGRGETLLPTLICCCCLQSNLMRCSPNGLSNS